ncbi:MAG: exopolyphosphatase [Pontibacterium sp.]
MLEQAPSSLPNEATTEPSLLAAIDLGSNSFHMVVAHHTQGELKPIDLLSEKVQLAAGLDENKILSDEAKERGLDCLRRFAQRISSLPRESVRVVGTNSLREAHNAKDFMDEASQILGVPLEIIAGREEARLIYLGVSHSLADDQGKRLVVDIGGGSTEFIIGERFEPIELESLHLGCVSFSKRFFADGSLSPERFNKAKTAARRELLSIQDTYCALGWSSAVGSSGTIKAVKNAIIACGYSEDGLITPKALKQLSQHILTFDRCEEVKIDGIKPERLKVLPAGLAILCGLFEALGIKDMTFSDGALREGLLYDMTGRLSHEDVRERTVTALMQRYHVDAVRAEQVEAIALLGWAQIKNAWQLQSPHYHDMLRWGALTHSVGLAISHSQYHKHGAYLLRHSDLPGFTQFDQELLAILARGHRRKLPKEEFKQLPSHLLTPYRYLCVLLRLAVLLQRSLGSGRLPAIDMVADENKLELTFPQGWLDHHPLTAADLEQEAEYLKAIEFKLKIR